MGDLRNALRVFGISEERSAEVKLRTWCVLGHEIERVSRDDMM